MAIKNQETHESQQIGLVTKQRSSHQTDDNELCFLNPPPTNNSLGSPSSSTDAIIIDEETLEQKNNYKKRKLGSWWDDVGAFNELSGVVKGLPKSKDDSYVVARFDSCFSPTNNSSGSSLPSTDAIIIIDDGEDEEETLEPENKKQRLGSCYNDVEAFNELSGVVKGLSKDDDAASRCFSSTDLYEKMKDDERSVPSHSDFTDLCEDECVGESSTSNKGHQHVSLEDLGVSIEDLKSMPWDAFDPTWEIRLAMDPWLGGYIEDILSSQ